MVATIIVLVLLRKQPSYSAAVKAVSLGRLGDKNRGTRGRGTCCWQARQQSLGPVSRVQTARETLPVARGACLIQNKVLTIVGKKGGSGWRTMGE